MGKNLIVETEVVNLTDGKMPVAFGFHPHFNNVTKIDIHGINYKIPVNSRTIPVKPSEFDAKDCDTTAHMYKMINNWHVTMMTMAGKVEMTTSGYPYMLHWTPPNSNYIAVEPMMSNIDLFNNDGATVINKDETYTAIFKLSF